MVSERCFSRFSVPSGPPHGDLKSSKTIGELFKNKVRTTSEKDDPERGPGLHFGDVLVPFSDDFGRKSRQSLKKHPSENDSKKSQKKAVALNFKQGGGPLELTNPQPPGGPYGHSNTPLRAERARWRIIIPIYGLIRRQANSIASCALRALWLYLAEA